MINERERKNREELFKLMQEHPELPIVAMVDAEIVADDGYNRWLGAWGSVYVGEYIIGEDKVHFREDDDPYEEEHIEMWVEARRHGTSGVPSIRELVKDAEAIDAMLKELAEALFKAELEVEGA